MPLAISIKLMSFLLHVHHSIPNCHVRPNLKWGRAARKISIHTFVAFIVSKLINFISIFTKDVNVSKRNPAIDSENGLKLVTID